MKNVIAVTFSDETKTYEVLSDLKLKGGDSTIISAGIMKNENNNLVIKDGFVMGDEDFSYDWAIGGLLGGLVGILGGPIGILLGASLGGLTGALVDREEADDEQDILTNFASKTANNTLTLIALVNEEDEAELDSFFSQYDTTSITRESFVSVQAEVYKAEALQGELAKETRKKMREDKMETWKSKAEEKQKEIREKLDSFRSKK